MGLIARCCGGTGTCACKIEAGRNITIVGLGSSQAPYVVAADVSLTVEDSAQFDLGLAGNGTLESPWILSAGYSGGAKLDGLPDVNAPAPSNGQVLSWNAGLGQWTPAAPTTAGGAGVSTNESLSGNGTVGTPLSIRLDSARYLSMTANGVGWNTEAINRTFRVFADAGSRTSDPTPPALNTVSILNSAPGQLDYWNGTAWVPILSGVQSQVQPGQFLQMSGPYVDSIVTHYAAQLSTTADGAGVFEVISSTDLAGYAGVLSVQVQPTGTVGWTVMVNPDTNRIIGKAFRLDTGAPYAGLVVTGMVSALLY